MQKLHVDWRDVHAGSIAMAAKMRSYKPQLIVGISRGGLIPAVIIAHQLEVPLAVIKCVAYEGTARNRKPVSVEGWTDALNSPDVWFVDDIYHTGDTLHALEQQCAHRGATFQFAALYAKDKPLTRGFAQYVLPDNPWVVFPWEVE